MLKAGSLVYAIIIALVIALTSSSLISYSYFSSVSAESYFDKERIMRNARSGINLLLCSQSIHLRIKQNVRRGDKIDKFAGGKSLSNMQITLSLYIYFEQFN